MWHSCTDGYRQLWANREQKLIWAQCLTIHHVDMKSWKKKKNTQEEKTHSDTCSGIQSVTHLIYNIHKHSYTLTYTDTFTYWHIHSWTYLLIRLHFHINMLTYVDMLIHFLHMNMLVPSHTERLMYSHSLTHEHFHTWTYLNIHWNMCSHSYTHRSLTCQVYTFTQMMVLKCTCM